MTCRAVFRMLKTDYAMEKVPNSGVGGTFTKDAPEGRGMGEEEFRQSNEQAAQAVGNLPDSDSDERL